jgi:mannonate dehydratase
MPVFSLKRMVTLHYLKRSEANILSAVRRYNPVLFDFLLKRSLAFNGRRLPANVFHSRRLFEPTAARSA